MARKRRRDAPEYLQSESEEDVELRDFQRNFDGSEDVDLSGDDIFADEPYVSDEFDSSDEEDDINVHLYQQVVADYKQMKLLKNKLKHSITNQFFKKKTLKKPKYAFTRFSASGFAKVLENLTIRQKEVIQSYGFGSLLLFDKCFVPNQFSKWVARAVDYKSGDIVIDGKIVSLTKESVHWVLGLPLGDRSFPSDSKNGKSIVLNKFNKSTIPNVDFFIEKILSKDNELSDEDTFICFILIALNSFLCSNSSLAPSPKYFGIFEDISNCKDFDWCGYILSWLLKNIKSFNQGKTKAGKEPGTLGGCVYYLAVMYLDHVDFGPRRVDDSLPRISVWKRDMIQSYSEFDKKSQGVYGFRPLLNFADTCFAKSLHHLKPNPSVLEDSDFLDKMDSFARCKLPSELKVSICKAIERHTCSLALQVNFDITSISSLPEPLLTTFTKLMKHASSTESTMKKIVLEVLKLITECPYDSADDTAPASPPLNCDPNSSVGCPQENFNQADKTQDADITHDDNLILSQTRVVNTKFGVTENSHTPPRSCLKKTSTASHDLASSSKSLPPKENFGRVNPNLETPNSHSVRTPSKRFVMPPSGYLSDHPIYRKSRSRFDVSENYVTGTNIAALRDPLVDISNVSKSNSQNTGFSDVIPLDDDDNDDVDDSSKQQSPTFQSKRPLTYCVEKNHGLSNKSPLIPKRNTPLRISPLLSQKRHVSFTSDASRHKAMDSPVEIVCEKSLSQKVCDITRKIDEMYNSKFPSSGSSVRTPIHVDGPDLLQPESSNSMLFSYKTYVSRDSSSGGKLALHGPRRVAKPSVLFNGDFETDKAKFSVTSSEVQNYKAICSLASSQFSNEDAICFGKVRCTFWSLGESLKPGGFVNPFVISAFCYSLYIKPTTNTEISKSHFFFANIGENLLKEADEANDEILARAFKRSSLHRPLHHSNNLFFPTMFNDHWFVFVVNIKDMKFAFLDSIHTENHEFSEIVRDRMIPSFQLCWDRFIKINMNFHDYKVAYPDVPQQSLDNSVDSGIYAMMFLEQWKSPRTNLRKIFDSSDIPNIRIKFANDLMFLPSNKGKKELLLDCDV